MEYTAEQQLKELILSRYKSIHAFTKLIGIPHSTFDSILKRGILNANISNILKITNELNIDIESLVEGELVTRGKKRFPTATNVDSDDFKETEFNDIANYIEFVKRKHE